MQTIATTSDITAITGNARSSRYDAVVVGGRAAGASTAMLLARRGLRVLVVDRDGYGSDTLSTHALMRGAINQLEGWGVAAPLRAVTPSITSIVFHYGDREQPLDATSEGTSSPLIAPRRTVLDRVLVDYASDAGVEFRHRTKLIALDRDITGRVIGVELEDRKGRRSVVGADLVIGADGLNSTVARQLEVPVTRQGTEASAYVMRYLDGVDLDRSTYHWLYRPEIGAGFIPTVDGQFVVFAAMTRDRFRNEIRADVSGGFHRVLDEVDEDFGAKARAAVPAGPVRAWPGRPGQFRKAYGPGWALVGDAGYFKDPFAAHGISDALRDAELLADAVVDGDFAGYEHARNELSAPLFEALESIASYRWTLDDLPGLHLNLGKAMTAEQRTLSAHFGRADRSALAA
ncbi:MAG: NAD(P)/FAD-dependent oxidoreductase [Acidimicrobiales bacterium]